jgi:Flp pilus assembly protein TadB
MGRGGGRHRQQPIRGFRPGKEPPELRKQRARAQLGGHPNWAQKQLVDALADRTPAEAQALMRRWRIGLLAAAVALLVVGSALYVWSIIAGIVAHVLVLGLLLLWFQLRRKREDFEAMARLVSGSPPGRGKKKKKKG